MCITYVPGALRGPEENVGFSGTGVRDVCNLLAIWVLKIEPRSFGGAASALNP